MTDIAIVAAVRTPVGSFRGAFAPLSAVDLNPPHARGEDTSILCLAAY